MKKKPSLSCCYWLPVVRTGKNIKILKVPYYKQYQVFSVQSGLHWSSFACLIITISTIAEMQMELQKRAVKTESFKNFTEYHGIDHYLTFFFRETFLSDANAQEHPCVTAQTQHVEVSKSEKKL